MEKKIAIVTGANSGIGKEIAFGLLNAGMHTILACRDKTRGEEALAELKKRVPAGEAELMLVDIADQSSIRRFADEFKKRYQHLDVLVNNAGAWWLDKRKSVDGIELQWATNVLGPHLLTKRLVDALKASGKARIVTVASTAAGGLDLSDVEFDKRPFSGVKAYSATKQANRMLTWQWAETLKGSGVTANAMSPELVSTGLNRSATGMWGFVFSILKLFARTPTKGAETALWLAVSDEVTDTTGTFFVDKKKRECKFRIAAEMQRLWDLVEAQSKATSQAA